MKKEKIIFWVTTSIIFLWEGLMPLGTILFAQQYVTAGTKPLGYPDYFAYALIIFKFLGSTALMLPKLPAKLREWAYAGLTFSLIFATISHCAVDMIPGFIIMPIAVLLILAVSYIYDQKIRKTQTV
jgi:hypothetical protein